MFPEKIFIRMIFLACILFSLVPLSADRPAKEKIDIAIKKRFFGKATLYVNSCQALHFEVKNLIGNKIIIYEWGKTKNPFSKAVDYVNIEIKPLNGWQISNARIKDSLDEQSYHKNGIILTIYGIQKVSSGYKVARNSGILNILLAKESSELRLSLRVAEFKESHLVYKKKYFLCYSGVNKAFNLIVDNDEEEDIEFPADMTL
ncbi:MAG: hypothetical protein N2445_03405 [Acidobacteria bacterium]|nr:hypothetical protein [Acidobacteriota bacterium]